MAQDRGQQTVINALRCRDPALLLKKGVATGPEKDAVLRCYFSQLPDKVSLFLVVWRREGNALRLRLHLA